ncbi:hypothetical protein CEXT_304141 [Caerostris extrusa]|uniref:Uncharacterized protein n=1 Tax=Caerostris extrusa TaxID=172846 RepID=A0AAV4MET9_CAEEX|nr:hypothetical protein CEXT_304141 [Caerostris extrusa]
MLFKQASTAYNNIKQYNTLLFVFFFTTRRHLLTRYLTNWTRILHLGGLKIKAEDTLLLSRDNYLKYEFSFSENEYENSAWGSSYSKRKTVSMYLFVNVCSNSLCGCWIGSSNGLRSSRIFQLDLSNRR